MVLVLGKLFLKAFFELLTDKQKANIKAASGDGAGWIKGTSKNRFEKRKCVSRVEDEERLRRLADARRGDLTKYSAGLARFLSNGFLEVP